LGVAALGVVSVALPSACASNRETGDAIVVGMTNSAVNLDPRVGVDEASQKAHQLLYGTLVRLDDTLKVVPDVAESLERPD
jgi:ABC-type transport system substrate-binding protein